MLFPAVVLVLVVLAAIAVDAAVAFLGERELAATVAAAANDAAVGGIDRGAFYRCGALQADPATAASVARAAIAARTSDAVTITHVEVHTDPRAAEPRVRVSARGTVRLIFSAAIPGGTETLTVDAVSSAAARHGGAAVPSEGCDP